MNLRRLRMLSALCLALVVLVAYVPLARLVRHADSARLDAEAITEARQRINDAFFTQARGEVVTEPLLWYVDASGSVREFGETTIQPPFRRLIRSDNEGVTTESFRQGDVEYLGYAATVKRGEGYVSVVDLTGFRDERGTVRLRLWLVGFVLAIGAAALGWWLSGRTLRPATQAMAERRGFLADAAHEMRTPLAIILASASQALSRPRSGEEYVRSLAEIRAAAERASSGVNELLDLARLESGQAMPRLAPLRLDLLAEEVAAVTRTEGCAVVAEPAAEAVVVDADLALLRQAVDNVVRNAVVRGSEISLTTRIDGRDGVLTVDDNGPGFDPAVLPTIFERYRRGDRNGQIGLGLSLVRAILAAHGGAVTAANRSEGGASIVLRIPLSRGPLG